MNVNKPIRNLMALAGAGALCAGLAACGDGGSSEGTARLSSYLNENTSMGKAVNAWADEVEQCSDGKQTFERFHNGALFGASDTRDALSGGRVDVAAFSAGYHTGEFPLTDGLFSVPFVSTNTGAVMDALNKTYDENEQAQAEWRDQNMELMSMLPVTPVPIATNKPIEKIEDLSGLNLRGYPAGGINAALRAAGANPVDMELADLPEAMQRGVVDGFVGVGLDSITAMSLQENAKYFTEPGFGSTGALSIAANSDWYDGLPEDVRNCVDQANDNLVNPYMELIAEAETASCEAIREEGGEVSALPDSEIERWRGMIGEGEVENWKKTAKGKVDDPQAYLDAYRDAVKAAEADHEGATYGAATCLEN